MNAPQILAKAEYCWREHIATMITSAMAVELIQHQNKHPQSSIPQAISNDKGYLGLMEIINCLLDRNMKFHPKVSGRYDVVHSAENYINKYCDERTLTSLELAMYFLDDSRAKKNLIDKAICTHPSLLRLYYMRKEFIDKPKNQLKTLKNLHDLGAVYRGGRVAYTPLTHMAIGHMGKFLDSRIYIKEFRRDQDIQQDIIYDSNNSSCHGLLQFLKKPDLQSNTDWMARLVSYKFSSIFDLALHTLYDSYQANPEPEWFDVKTRNRCAHCVTTKNLNFSKVVMHLRTGNFKYNDAVPTMGIRSVQPNSYKALVDYLASHGTEVTHITADNPPHTIPGCTLLHVSDSNTESIQWNEYSKAHFVIGTQSGISHLLELGPQSGYLTNYTCIPVDALVRKSSLLHCKRIDHLSNLSSFSKAERLSLLVYQWGHGEGALAEYSTVRDLTPDELRYGIKEYLSLQSGNYHEYTLYRLLVENNLDEYMRCLPDCNLSMTTFQDMMHILGY